jgi:hypothetical protein
VNRRRLSSAIRPKQAEYFPFLDLDADIVDGANGLVVDLREIVRFNDVRHFGFLSCSAGFNINAPLARKPLGAPSDQQRQSSAFFDIVCDTVWS